jgi:hypothetical protein
MVQANGNAGDADLLSTMIEGSVSADGDKGLIDNLFTFFFAGFDTSSVALAFAIWEISQRPLVEKKLLDEIHEVLCVQLHHFLFRPLFPFAFCSVFLRMWLCVTYDTPSFRTSAQPLLREVEIPCFPRAAGRAGDRPVFPIIVDVAIIPIALRAASHIDRFDHLSNYSESCAFE